jgi:hypothetical protein
MMAMMTGVPAFSTSTLAMADMTDVGALVAMDMSAKPL